MRADWFRKRGRQVQGPAPLPDIPEHLLDLWQCFLDCHTTRREQMGREPIEPQAVVAWCELHGVTERRRAMLWRVVRHLDKEALRLLAAKEKQRGKPETGD